MKAMKNHRLVSIILAASAIGLSGPINAQCLECAQQMFQATLTTNAWYNINQDQIDQTRSRDAGNGICYDANRSFGECRDRATASGPTGTAPAIGDRLEDAVLAVLDAEHRRRVRAYGAGNADQWLNKAAGDVGRQIGRLNAEYRRRLVASGSSGADRWYVDNASRIATRYVDGNRGANVVAAASNGIPATTRQRAEDATFAVFEPEIKRRSKEDGQTATVEWARTVGLAVGTGVRNLAPEYLQRAKVDGRASADAWYVDQARNLATRQIRIGH